MARIIDGIATSRDFLASLDERIREFRKNSRPLSWKPGAATMPDLAVILASGDPASASYVAKKVSACKKLDFYCSVYDWSDWKKFPYDNPTPEEHVKHWLAVLQNREYSPHGIIVQLPVEDCADSVQFYSMIDPLKDVDCFHPYNVGLVTQGRPRFLPCTPAGIIELLKRNDISIEGKSFAIVNNSDIVGKPLAMMLTQQGATVSICQRKSDPDDVKAICRMSDIIVVGVGIPCFLTKDYIDPSRKQTVVDVGINRVNKDIVGDAHPEIYELIDAYTPVPGGVGPMTVAMLMNNVLTAAELQR